eukprot:7652468-Pyramimonas_sp.AAC.1
MAFRPPATGLLQGAPRSLLPTPPWRRRLGQAQAKLGQISGHCPRPWRKPSRGGRRALRGIPPRGQIRRVLHRPGLPRCRPQPSTP